MVVVIITWTITTPIATNTTIIITKEAFIITIIDFTTVIVLDSEGELKITDYFIRGVKL